MYSLLYFYTIGVLDDAEKIDVGVVDGEVDEHGTGRPIQPEIVEQRLEQFDRFFHGRSQILHETASLVHTDLAPVA